MPVPTGTQSIDRAAQLLVMVVESDDPVSIGELAERTDLPKSTVSRLVSALERQALVQRASTRGPLRAGPVLMRLAHRGVSDRDLVELCEPTLERLAEVSGETVNLGVPDLARRRAPRAGRLVATSSAPPTGSAAECACTPTRSARCSSPTAPPASRVDPTKFKLNSAFGRPPWFHFSFKGNLFFQK